MNLQDYKPKTNMKSKKYLKETIFFKARLKD